MQYWKILLVVTAILIVLTGLFAFVPQLEAYNYNLTTSNTSCQVTPLYSGTSGSAPFTFSIQLEVPQSCETAPIAFSMIWGDGSTSTARSSLTSGSYYISQTFTHTYSCTTPITWEAAGTASDGFGNVGQTSQIPIQLTSCGSPSSYTISNPSSNGATLTVSLSGSGSGTLEAFAHNSAGQVVEELTATVSTPGTFTYSWPTSITTPDSYTVAIGVYSGTTLISNLASCSFTISGSQSGTVTVTKTIFTTISGSPTTVTVTQTASGSRTTRTVTTTIGGSLTTVTTSYLFTSVVTTTVNGIVTTTILNNTPVVPQSLSFLLGMFSIVSGIATVVVYAKEKP